MSKKAVVILEVMWDWRNVAGQAGYRERAPRHFDINPHNFTGRRLHAWLKDYPGFRTTNACPELVSSAKGRGKPCKEWVRENLAFLAPFDLLLVCGSVAAKTYERASANGARIIHLPHPAARCWHRQGLDFVATTIKHGSTSVRIFRKPDGYFTDEPLAGSDSSISPLRFPSKVSCEPQS